MSHLNGFFISWSDATCILYIHVPLLRTAVIPNVTFDRFLSFMNTCNMYTLSGTFDNSCSCKFNIWMASLLHELFCVAVVANLAFEWLHSFMNSYNMSIHFSLLRTAVITNVTFERLFHLMNWCNICTHVPLMRTAVIKNVTFEWLFSFICIS